MLMKKGKTENQQVQSTDMHNQLSPDVVFKIIEGPRTLAALRMATMVIITGIGQYFLALT